MKKILLAIICVLPTHLFGQIELNDSVRHTVVSIYAGTLAGPKIAIHDGKTSGLYTFRAGGMITYSPQKWISLFGLGAGETAQTDTTTPFTLMGIRLMPSRTITVTMGKIASVLTEFRPLPTTGGGQFEPWTKSHILGSTLGGKIAWNPRKTFSVTVGECMRGTDASTEMSVGFSHIKIGGSYMNQSKLFGGVLEINYKYISNTLMFNQKQNAGMLNVIEIPKSNGVSFYSDMGFDPNHWKMIRGEWGMCKTFRTHYLSGLIGVGFCNETQAINGYVFMHI